MTHGGASFAKEESVDGRSLLYWREKDGTGPVVAHPLDGGPDPTLVECATGWSNAFRVRPSGIYYRSCGKGGNNPMRLLDAAGRTHELGMMPDDQGARFAVSPDGKAILYSRDTSRSPDLMMIENFQ